MVQVTDEKRAEGRKQVAQLAPLIIRVGRTFIQCVTVPNRNENADGEAAFAHALSDLAIAFVELDV